MLTSLHDTKRPPGHGLQYSSSFPVTSISAIFYSPRKCVLLAVCLVLLASSVAAQDKPVRSATDEDTTRIKQGSGGLVERTAAALLKQREATLFGRPHMMTALPIVYYDLRNGVSFGFRSVLHAAGKTPYLYRVSLQLLASHKGSHKHKLDLDFPDFRESGFGFGLQAWWERDLEARYYGTGNNSVRDEALITKGRPGFVDEDYYIYNLKHPRLTIYGTRSIWANLTFSLGFGLDFAEPQLKNDANHSFIAREQPFGFWGGSGRKLLFRLTWDSRNDDTFPRRGMLSEVTFEPNFVKVDLVSSSQIQKKVTFQRYAFSMAVFVPFYSEKVILANRFAFEAVSGEPPYYALGEIAGQQLTKTVGGSSSLRGFQSQRFQDKVKYISLTELRCKISHFVLFSNVLDLVAVGFFDSGRVWSDVSSLSVDDIHTGFGGGLWVNLNEGMIVRFDVGRSREGWVPFLQLGGTF